LILESKILDIRETIIKDTGRDFQEHLIWYHRVGIANNKNFSVILKNLLFKQVEVKTELASLYEEYKQQYGRDSLDIKKTSEIS
jgi:hypothetical protein